MKTVRSSRNASIVPFVGALILISPIWIGCYQSTDQETVPEQASEETPATREAEAQSTEQDPVEVVEEGQPSEDSSVRNVLLITLDTLRWDYLSCYGNETAATPNIDHLAERGVLFEQAVVQVPLTLPSHASILSGTYPQVHGVRDIGGFVLDPSVPTMATIAKAGGVRTAAFVGAAVLHRRFQLSLGFDVYNDDMSSLSEEEKLPGVVAEVRAEVVSDRVIEWLKGELENGTGKEIGKPFFLWAHYYDPHRPFDPPEPYKSRYSSDLYAGESAYTDTHVGRILSFLDESGLAENTLVVLVADHGESLGEHGEYTHGVFLYESTVHVPLIIAGPGVMKGERIDQQVRSIDLMPTVVKYLGLDPGDKVQGESLLPILFEGRGVRTTYSYMETLYPMSHMGWSELRGIRSQKWKLIIAPQPELYQLDVDPQEKENVVQRFPVDAERLQKQVWQVAGPPEELGTLDYQPLDEESLAELKSLGYVSAGIRRELRIDMSGPDPKTRTKSLEILEEAGEMMNTSKFREASRYLVEGLKEDPTNPVMYQHLSLCYNRLGEYRKALAVNEQAIEHGAETDETFAEIGEIYIRFGQLRMAAEAMEKAAERNPTNLQNFINLGTVYIQLGEIDEAERVLKAILTQEDKHAMAYNLLGVLEIQRGRDNLARANFEKAVLYDPYLTEPYMNLGILAQEAGETERALSYYRKFVERASPDEHGEILGKVRLVIAELEHSLGSN